MQRKTVDFGDVERLVESGDVEGVRAWIGSHQHSNDFVKKMNATLIGAVKKGHADMVAVLVEEGRASANTCEEGSWVSPLIILLNYLCLICSDIYVLFYMYTIQHKDRMLMLAAEGGHVEVVRVLMRNGALVDEMDKVRGFPKHKPWIFGSVSFNCIPHSF